jgi:fatty-acyl-CoA synthase
MVKTGGINVAPAEVEEVLSAHPAVELAFVTGLPDPRLDEMLAAVIVIRDGATADPESLAAHCRETLAAYKTPRQFRFVTASELPLTSTGKLQRKRLAELFA